MLRRLYPAGAAAAASDPARERCCQTSLFSPLSAPPILPPPSRSRRWCLPESHVAAGCASPAPQGAANRLALNAVSFPVVVRGQIFRTTKRQTAAAARGREEVLVRLAHEMTAHPFDHLWDLNVLSFCNPQTLRPKEFARYPYAPLTAVECMDPISIIHSLAVGFVRARRRG